MRTKGSGWGGGPILYQLCPLCNKKKAYYNPISDCSPFECTYCKERFKSDNLIRKTHAERNK